MSLFRVSFIRSSIVQPLSVCVHRLQRLEELAASVLGTVTTTSVTLDQLEGDVAEFEAGCTSLSLADGGVEERARNIRHKLQV